ncbi:hypothetical protein [Streptobacillus moniliformis]|uniref:hypothetical protein n=1 Tax=Streptobacillus moniliformis TaxID=34105 RepID=UPI0018C85FEC|nr:hypothetical protein [Streptobacillus moniliformis]
MYSMKEFRSEEELIETVKRHERLYNNRAKPVLTIKSPNEVGRESRLKSATPISLHTL